MNEDNREPSNPTLTEFIDDNHKLISVAAIFATLSILTLKLPDQTTGKFLSFLLFSLVLIICLEIQGNFPWVEKGKFRLFQEVFFVTVVGFIYVWVTAYYAFLLTALFQILYLLSRSNHFCPLLNGDSKSDAQDAMAQERRPSNEGETPTDVRCIRANDPGPPNSATLQSALTIRRARTNRIGD